MVKCEHLYFKQEDQLVSKGQVMTHREYCDWNSKDSCRQK